LATYLDLFLPTRQQEQQINQIVKKKTLKKKKRAAEKMNYICIKNIRSPSMSDKMETAAAKDG